MMTIRDVSDLLSEIYEAIQQNDLEKIKELVEILNTDCAPMNDPWAAHFIEAHNPFQIFHYLPDNEAYQYLIENFKYSEAANYARWTHFITPLMSPAPALKERNLQIIENLLTKEYTEEELEKLPQWDYARISLIELCYMIQDFTFLERIKTKVDWNDE